MPVRSRCTSWSDAKTRVMLSRKGMNADIELFLSGLEKYNNNNQ